VHFISFKPVLSDHLSYVTIFHCSLGRSHKTDVTVFRWSILNGSYRTFTAMCRESCPPLSYGDACLKSCDCSPDGTSSCSPIDGTCLCKSGYYGKPCFDGECPSHIVYRGTTKHKMPLFMHRKKNCVLVLWMTICHTLLSHFITNLVYIATTFMKSSFVCIKIPLS
jgi:hypothetical protein